MDGRVSHHLLTDKDKINRQVPQPADIVSGMPWRWGTSQAGRPRNFDNSFI